MDHCINFIIDKYQKFKELYLNHEKRILLIVFGLFIYLTTVGVFTHEPWLDEAQAWLIAQDLNFFELLKHMKYEGHMFLWFLALMPSAKLHITYPLPMLITNVIFMWAAIYFFLVKCPINSILKILITFSMPLAYQYAVIARPYAMGIFLLFVLAALYENKLKRPFLYSTLIILCANTSSMALCGAVAFAILFMVDYFRNNKTFYKSKEFYIILTIALVGIFLLGFQLLGAGKQIDIYTQYYLYALSNVQLFFASLYEGLFIYDFNSLSYLYIILSSAMVLLSLSVFRKDKQTLFFYLFTYSTLMLIFLKVYNGYIWHHLFFFIYFLISLWLFCSRTKDKGIMYKLLIALFTFSLFFSLNLTYYKYYNDINFKVSNAESFAIQLSKEKKYKDSNIIVCDEGATNVVPYLRNLGVNAYSCFDNKKASFFNRKYGKDLFIKKDVLTPKYFKKFEDKKMYLIYLDNPRARMGSDYYKLSLEFCSKPASMDWVKYCLVELEKGY